MESLSCGSSSRLYVAQDRAFRVYTLRPVQSRCDFGNDITTKESRVSIDYQDGQERISESSNSLTYSARGACSNDGRSLRSTIGSPATACATVHPLLWIGLIKWRKREFLK